ncbi:MAG: hypothetical protein J6T60_10140 [Bacteroidales bacterium]|nr:hypothetical protein [Bacteroidales bacterium]
MNISIKSIFRETIQHFKSNWIKLMLMSLIGYLLPLGVFVWFTFVIFSEDMDDCAPCALAAMFIELFLFVGLSFVLSCAKIFIRAFCHKSLDNQFKGFGNLVDASGFRFLPFELIFDLFCLGPWLIFFAMFSDFIELQMIIILCTLPFLMIFILFVFVPNALCSSDVKFWMSFRVSNNLVKSNYGIVLKTVALSCLISILLCCTGVGIIVAVPFSILVKTVLYRKLVGCR